MANAGYATRQMRRNLRFPTMVPRDGKEPEGQMEPPQTRTTVGIIGGDPIVGQALELLLQTGGYEARFLPNLSVGGFAELLADIKLLLLAPALGNRCRQSLMEDLAHMPATSKIPVLSLISASGETPDSYEDAVLWPCPAEELKTRIDAALLATGSAQSATA